MNNLTKYEGKNIWTNTIDFIKNLKTLIEDVFYSYREGLDRRYCGADTVAVRIARKIRKVVHALKWIILLLIAIPTIGYCLIQMNMAGFHGYFPDFVNTWVSSIDKSTLPLVFHEKQGHPVILFIIWCMMFRFSCRFIYAIFKMFKSIDTAWLGVADVMIIATLFFCSMNTGFVYWFPFVLGFLEFNMNVHSKRVTDHGFKLFDINGNFVGRIEKY